MSQPTSFDALLTQCRDLVCERLDAALAAMLDKADDALLAMVAETREPETQRLYLDTRDKLLSQRQAIETQFRTRYLREFQQRSNRVKKIGASFSDIDLSSLELELIGEDDLNETLKESSRGTAGPRRNHLRNAFVILEVAISLVLLVCAGLMMRSFYRLSRVDPGFEAENTVAMDVKPGSMGKPLPGVEAALALMRDMLIADKQALLQSLAATQAQAADGWLTGIPTAGQMLLGFILPFALAFIAIPLESLIHSSRTVGGVLLAGVVSTLALVMRVLANVARRMARVLITLYDVVIVLPLLAERLTKAGMAMRHGVDTDSSARQARAR